MEKPLSRIGSEKKELNKIRIYLRDISLVHCAGLRRIYKSGTRPLPTASGSSEDDYL